MVLCVREREKETGKRKQRESTKVSGSKVCVCVCVVVAGPLLKSKEMNTLPRAWAMGKRAATTHPPAINTLSQFNPVQSVCVLGFNPPPPCP